MLASSQSYPLKYRLRSALDLLASTTGLLHRYELGMRQGLTILMYHRILSHSQCRNYPLASLVIPREVFRQQMQWLAGHCHVLPVQEALAKLVDGEPSTRPLVAITFDDGYADNFELAAPVLAEHGLRATFFVSSGFVEMGKVQWFDRAADAWLRIPDAERRTLLDQVDSLDQGIKKQTVDIQTWMHCLKAIDHAVRINLVRTAESLADGSIKSELYRPMTPEQVMELHRRGHEIGSHAVSHPILPQLSDDELQDELAESAAQLRDLTGSKIFGFCYPNGDFDSRVEQAVAKAGYTYACTTRTGMNRSGSCPTRLVRRAITMQRTVPSGKYDPLGFRAELCGFRDWWR